jgi:hypothetical protein
MNLTITGKSVDEEEYLLIRMHREKMVGGNLRNGSREVAFELWIQRIRLIIPVVSNGIFRRYHGKLYRK